MALPKRVVAVILRTSISVCLLVFLFMRVDIQAVWGIIARSNLAYLGFAVFLILCVFVLCLVRWKLVLTAAGIAFPLKQLVVPFLGGSFLNTFLPSTIGGDILRSAHVAKDSKKTANSVASVLLDRLSGFVGIVAVALAALFFGGRAIATREMVAAVMAMAAALLAVIIVVFHPRVYGWVRRAVTAGRPGNIRQTLAQIITVMHEFRAERGVILKSIGLSFLIQVISPLITLLICRAVGGEVNPLHFFVLMPVIGAITLLPVSLGGIGFRDALVVYGFSRVGLLAQTALAMSLVNTTLTVFFACVCGIIYVFALYSRRL